MYFYEDSIKDISAKYIALILLLKFEIKNTNRYWFVGFLNAQKSILILNSTKPKIELCFYNLTTKNKL